MLKKSAQYLHLFNDEAKLPRMIGLNLHGHQVYILVLLPKTVDTVKSQSGACHIRSSQSESMAQSMAWGLQCLYGLKCSQSEQ